MTDSTYPIDTHPPLSPFSVRQALSLALSLSLSLSHTHTKRMLSLTHRSQDTEEAGGRRGPTQKRKGGGGREGGRMKHCHARVASRPRADM